MYKITIDQNNVVTCVFDSNVYLPSESTFSITDEEFKKINESKQFNYWQYIDGKIVESQFKQEILKNKFNSQQKINREKAYQLMSDPIFMKWQRQEATQQEWLDKIEQIKLMYPYQE
jgi:hypothetical protein